jgi:hypothetical protein
MNLALTRFQSLVAFASRSLLLVGAAAALCALSVGPTLAGDLFYTISFGGPNGTELVAVEVSGSKVTTRDIGPTNGGDCGSLALSPSGKLYSMCGSLLVEHSVFQGVSSSPLLTRKPD